MTSIISVVSHAKKTKENKISSEDNHDKYRCQYFYCIKNTYRNMTTISVLLATSSSGASESRNTCNASL